MMRKAILLAAVAALATCLNPREARADSDGYYCVGPGYIAHEARSWDAEGPHLLKIDLFGVSLIFGV